MMSNIVNFQEMQEVLLILITSLAVSIAIVPFQIKKFKEKRIVAVDYYKNEPKYVPTAGGLSILLVFFLMFVLTSILNEYLLEISDVENVAVLVIVLFGIFGAIDDFVDVGRATKIFLPFLFSLPLALVLQSHTLFLPFVGEVSLWMLYLIVPAYVMVVSNLINMHSGFNGMAAGLSAIILATLLIKSVTYGSNTLLIHSTMLGAVLGFLYYNWYPSRIFDGNVGALTIGATIGIIIVANGFLVSGFIILIPHTVNFLMYIYWRVMRKISSNDERWKPVKFGKVREDGTLEVPNALTLKWVLPYYFRMTEKQTVLAMYGLTVVFCIAGLFVPY